MPFHPLEFLTLLVVFLRLSALFLVFVLHRLHLNCSHGPHFEANKKSFTQYFYSVLSESASVLLHQIIVTSSMYDMLDVMFVFRNELKALFLRIQVL